LHEEVAISKSRPEALPPETLEWIVEPKMDVAGDNLRSGKWLCTCGATRRRHGNQRARYHVNLGPFEVIMRGCEYGRRPPCQDRRGTPVLTLVGGSRRRCNLTKNGFERLIHRTPKQRARKPSPTAQRRAGSLSNWTHASSPRARGPCALWPRGDQWWQECRPAG